LKLVDIEFPQICEVFREELHGDYSYVN